MRWTFYLCGLHLQNILPQPNHDIISDISQLMDILQNTWLVLLETMKVIKDKESLRNCHSQEELKEIWWSQVMCSPGWAPEAEKGRQIKPREFKQGVLFNWWQCISIGTLVVTKVPYWQKKLITGGNGCGVYKNSLNYLHNPSVNLKLF